MGASDAGASEDADDGAPARESTLNDPVLRLPCPGSDAAPRTTGMGVQKLWIGECFGCSEWFNLATRWSRIPMHMHGDRGTYRPHG